MPELPDLQVFSKNLQNKLAGKKLKEISVLNDKKLNVTVDELQSSLQGQKLKEVYRNGKELFFEFAKGDTLAIHLMLHGGLNYFEKVNAHKYTLIELLFENDIGLALSDFQQAAHATLNPEAKKGVDALSKEMTLEAFKTKIFKSKASIKNVLMDQNLIRGIGNAYADEILWDARISPFSVSNKIPEENVTILYKSIKSVLKNAEEEIIKAEPDIISGEIRDFLLVHNYKKKSSPNGVKIEIKVNAGRKSYFTAEQVLYD